MDSNERASPAGPALAPNECVLELPGSPPTYLWARTCDMPRCDCRDAIVLVTDAGRQAVLEQAAVFKRAHDNGADMSGAAQALAPHAELFCLDIDLARAYRSPGENALDISDRPKAARWLKRLHGDHLDQLGRLWLSGKGEPQPEDALLQAQRVTAPTGWSPGKLIGWEEMELAVRTDLYMIRGQIYRAEEHYCPVPGCSCGQATVTFWKRRVRLPGRVVVNLATRTAQIEEGSKRMGSLWAAFQERHPNYIERLKQHLALAARLGEHLEMPDGSQPAFPKHTRHDKGTAEALDPPPPGAPLRSQKVGRNDPCPCGSGQKYKKCCGAGR